MPIIPAQRKHSAALVPLAKASFLHAHSHSAAPSIIEDFVARNYQEKALGDSIELDKNTYFISVDQERISGYSNLVVDQPNTYLPEKKVALLDRLYLDPEFFGQGIAHDLLEHNKQYALDQGCVGIWLNVWTENYRALRFYLKNGFQNIGDTAYRLSPTHVNPNYVMYLPLETDPDQIKMRPYQPGDASAFKSLNIEWLESYFQVEPIDHQVLGHPTTEIIQPGGYIFMAERQGKTIGTYAFIKKNDGVYEFSKMAIDPTLRGMGFGQFMLDHALTWAKVHRWSKILLYSNTKLENAIHLYRKNGFVEIPLEKEVIYSRGNIKMEYSIH